MSAGDMPDTPRPSRSAANWASHSTASATISRTCSTIASSNRRVDVLVQVEHEVVGDDRVAGGEERDQPAHQVLLRGREPGQVLEVGMQIDLLHRPGVPDGVTEPVIEMRVAHGAQ